MFRTFSGALALAFTLTMSQPVVAENAIEDVVKYRHAIMETMAGHATALTQIALGKIDQGDYLQGHADSIASATQELGILFPAGSGGEDSHALPAIWEDPEGFQEAIDSARQAGAALSEAATTGDSKTVMTAFAAVGKSCKGCHETYRKEHED